MLKSVAPETSRGPTALEQTFNSRPDPDNGRLAPLGPLAIDDWRLAIPATPIVANRVCAAKRTVPESAPGC
jgi:hypothetical protein